MKLMQTYPRIAALIFACVLTSTTTAQHKEQAQAQNATSMLPPPGAPVRIYPMPEHMAAVDVSGDGRAELLSVHEGKVCLLFGGQCDPLTLPGIATLWTVADVDGDHKDELLVLQDCKSLHRVDLVDGQLQLSEPLAENLNGTAPLGLHASSFVRDLDENGHPDLLIPRGDKILIWHGTDHGFQLGPEVGGMAKLMLESGSGQTGLLTTYRRSYTVPEPSTRDVNGDSRLDLLVRHEDLVHQYLASQDGFAATPSVEIELDQFKTEFNEASLDLSNLTKLLRYIVVDEWADLNGDGALDLLVLSNGKVRIFLGDESGVNLSRKVRSVKLDGNIFFADVAEINDDGIPDLVLVGVEDLGLAELAFSLITSFRLKFYFYVFLGKGDGSFKPRAYRNKTVTVEGGQLLKVIDENREQLSRMRETVVRLLDADGDGQRNDLAMLNAGGELGIWRNVITGDTPFGDASDEFLRSAFAERRDLKVDITTLTEWVLGRTSALISLTKDRPADWSQELSPWLSPHTMVARDFDGDGKDEILAVYSRLPELEEGEEFLGQALYGWILDPSP